jgi:hypothetical protein
VLAATLPSALVPKDMESLDAFRTALEKSVSRLIEMQPLLGCTVELRGRQGLPPCWLPHTVAPGTHTDSVSPQKIVELLKPHLTSAVHSHSPAQEHAVRDMVHPRVIEKLLLDGLAIGQDLNLIESEQLWKVHIAAHGPCGTENVTLVLIMHHVLADGVGARNLLSALLKVLTAELRNSADTPEHEADDIRRMTILTRMPFPPANEDTIDIRPSYGQLLGEVWDGIVKKLPKFIAPTVYQIWPNPEIAYAEPRMAAQRLAMFSIPAAVVKDVKEAARRRGVKTLHPVMQAVTLVALQAAFMEDDKLYDDPAHPMQIKISTPVSLRDERLGHPSVCGNYVAAFNHEYPVSSLRGGGHTSSSSAEFWDIALDFAQDVADPAKRKRAAATIGMLAYLSGSWEEWLMEKMMHSEAPFGASLELSNLGLFTTDEECGVEREEGFEIAWAQTASSTGDSLSLNVSFEPSFKDPSRQTLTSCSHGYGYFLSPATN